MELPDFGLLYDELPDMGSVCIEFSDTTFAGIGFMFMQFTGIKSIDDASKGIRLIDRSSESAGAEGSSGKEIPNADFVFWDILYMASFSLKSITKNQPVLLSKIYFL